MRKNWRIFSLKLIKNVIWHCNCINKTVIGILTSFFFSSPATQVWRPMRLRKTGKNELLLWCRLVNDYTGQDPSLFILNERSVGGFVSLDCLISRMWTHACYSAISILETIDGILHNNHACSRAMHVPEHTWICGDCKDICWKKSKAQSRGLLIIFGG